MTRASISLSPPNDAWIQRLIDSKEYSSRSEVVNDLIRQARARNRQRDDIIAKLEAAEASVEVEGWVTQSPQQMLAEFKQDARRRGKL